MNAVRAVLNAMGSVYPGDAAMVAAANVAALVAAVVVVAWIASRVLGRSWGAAARHGLWLCALACVVAGVAATAAFPGSVVSLVRLSSGGAEAAVAPTAAAPAAAAPAPAGPREPADTFAGSPAAPRPTSARGADAARRQRVTRLDAQRAAAGALAGMWLLGVALLTVRLARGWRSLCALRREAGAPDGLSAEVIDQVRRALGLKRGQPLPPVLQSSRVSSPVTFGLLRPVVVLPAGLPSRLPPAQLRDVLVHEFAHALRRDPLTGLVQRLVATVLWPHPLVHLLNRELNRAREELCDDYVLSGHAAAAPGRRGDDARGYARALVALAEMRGRASLGPPPRPRPFNPLRPAPPAVGILGGGWPLESRVGGLLDQRRRVMTRLNRPARMLLSLGFVLAATAAAGVRLLEAAPARAERPSGPSARPATNPAGGAAKAAPPGTAPSAADLLDRPLKDLNFPGVAFEDTLDFLRDVSGLNFVTDWRALEDAGIDRNTPVEYRAKEAKLRAALKAVTTLAGDAKNPVTYGLVGNVVFVSTPERVAAAVKGADALPGKAQDALSRQLMAQSPTELNFDGVALSDAVDFLRDINGATIFVHWRELEAVGVDRNTPVKIRLFNVPLDQALHLVLRVSTGGKADFTVEERQIMISSAEVVAGPARAAQKGPATAPARGGN